MMMNSEFAVVTECLNVEISSSQTAHTFASYHFTFTEPWPEPVSAIPSLFPTDSTEKYSLIN